ncbi:MAG TPA: C-GCAxxG-C-C family protein [Desulfatiglandales bacterium]|nr:C-GCAxxG-C-C family protein [Desulfatiglandales bacterium]
MLSVAESKDIQSELIPKISTGFCGGIARTCGMCGAVSGAIMAINVFLGRNLPAEPVDKSYMAVKKLINMFEGKFGSTNCKQLTGCDLGTEEGQRTFKLNNIIEKCRNYVEEATRIAMSIIEEKS